MKKISSFQQIKKTKQIIEKAKQKTIKKIIKKLERNSLYDLAGLERILK